MIEKSPKSETYNFAGRVESGRIDQSLAESKKVLDSRPRLFEVVIAGVPLRLKSSHDEQTVKELVALVDRKVNEALPLTRTGSIQNASILASLHLAEEILTLKKLASAELEKLENKTLKVISELESSRITGLLGKENSTEPHQPDRDLTEHLSNTDSLTQRGRTLDV